MAFVNKRFDDGSLEKEFIDKLIERHNLYVNQGCFDSDSGFILIKLWEGHDRDADVSISRWLLAKDGCEIFFFKKILEYKEISADCYKSTQKIASIVGLDTCSCIDKDLFSMRVFEAVHAYQEIGIYSTMKNYDLKIDFDFEGEI